MPSPTFDHTIFSYIPETFPTTLTNSDPIHCSRLPHYHVKHPIWYFNDADLFFSQRGILFGLHRQNFNNPYFSQWLQHIEPCKTTAIGTVSSLPISIDTLSISMFITFIQLLYQPNDFSTDIIGWKQIKDLAVTWGFVKIMLMAMRKIQTIGSQRPCTIRRLPLRTTVLTKYWKGEIVNNDSASEIKQERAAIVKVDEES
jgi:hypothetical protein